MFDIDNQAYLVLKNNRRWFDDVKHKPKSEVYFNEELTVYNEKPWEIING